MARSLDAQKTMSELLAAVTQKPEFLAGFNTDYLGNANQLFQNLGQQLGGFDTQQAQTEADYTRGIGDIASNQSQAIQALKNRMAARGTLGSTIFDEEQQNLVKGFDTQRADLGSARDRMVTALTGQRGKAESDYDNALMGLNQGLTNQAGAYVNTKSAEERDRRLAEQAANDKTTLADQQVGITNTNIPAMAPPTIDTAAIIRALTPAPPPAPPALPARFSQPQYQPGYVAPAPVAPKPQPSVYDPGRVALTSSVSQKKPLTPAKGRF
jgi:hypothetical protein